MRKNQDATDQKKDRTGLTRIEGLSQREEGDQSQVKRLEPVDHDRAGSAHPVIRIEEKPIGGTQPDQPAGHQEQKGREFHRFDSGRASGSKRNHKSKGGERRLERIGPKG